MNLNEFNLTERGIISEFNLQIKKDKPKDLPERHYPHYTEDRIEPTTLNSCVYGGTKQLIYGLENIFESQDKVHDHISAYTNDFEKNSLFVIDNNEFLDQYKTSGIRLEEVIQKHLVKIKTLQELGDKKYALMLDLFRTYDKDLQECKEYSWMKQFVDSFYKESKIIRYFANAKKEIIAPEFYKLSKLIVEEDTVENAYTNERTEFADKYEQFDLSTNSSNTFTYHYAATSIHGQNKNDSILYIEHQDVQSCESLKENLIKFASIFEKNYIAKINNIDRTNTLKKETGIMCSHSDNPVKYISKEYENGQQFVLLLRPDTNVSTSLKKSLEQTLLLHGLDYNDSEQFGSRALFPSNKKRDLYSRMNALQGHDQFMIVDAMKLQIDSEIAKKVVNRLDDLIFINRDYLFAKMSGDKEQIVQAFERNGYYINGERKKIQIRV